MQCLRRAPEPTPIKRLLHRIKNGCKNFGVQETFKTDKAERLRFVALFKEMARRLGLITHHELPKLANGRQAQIVIVRRHLRIDKALCVVGSFRFAGVLQQFQ